MTTNVLTPDRGAPRRAAGSRYARAGDVHVLRLSGSFYEMGRQHGELLRAEIPHGPMPYYRHYVEKLMARSGVASLSPLVWSALQHFVGKRVAAALPDFVLDTLRGLSAGSGMPLTEVLDAATMPDGLNWVVSRFIERVDPGPAVRHRLALGLGCTSAIAWDEATVDGKLLHARNFDYHGVESWPRAKAVLFHRPDDGMRYASVAAAGVPLGGVTAMNEAGLSLTVHQHMFTDCTRLGGMPIGIIGDVVMRKARSLDEAEAILATQTPIGCWTYLVADGRRREVLCWEENPDRRAPRRVARTEGSFGYANIYLDDELGRTEQHLYGSYWRHNAARHRRANERLRQRSAPLDPEAMAAVLADTGDERCRISESIAMLMTVGSVVFRPEDGIFWVATGQAPTSHQPYVAFDLATEDHAPEHGSLEGAVPSNGDALAAFDHYREAYLAHVDRADLPECRRRLELARALQPDEPLYAFAAGVLALVDGDLAAGNDALDRAVQLGHPHPERVSTFHLWRGRARDLAGRRRAALDDYRRALGTAADEAVHRAARVGLKRAFSARRARKAALDLTYADVMLP